MASLTGIEDPENQQHIEAKKRERAALILAKQAEKLRICGGFVGRRYVKGTLGEEITRLENTCVITGASCEMEDTGGNYQRDESYYKCKNCDKQTTHRGGRKKKTRRKKRRKKRRKSLRKKRTRKRRRKKRTKRRK